MLTSFYHKIYTFGKLFKKKHNQKSYKLVIETVNAFENS